MGSFKSNRHESKKREDSLAADLGGYSVVMSGGLWFRPGDVDTGKLLIEDKFTWDTKYVLKHEKLTKIKKQALFKRRIPLFSIEFNHKSSTALNIILIPIFYVVNDSVLTYVKEIVVTGKSLTFRYDEVKDVLNKNDVAKLNFLDKDEDGYLVMSYEQFLLNYKTILFDGA